MKKVNVIAAIVCLAVAVVIFVYADGARRIYSGGLFAVLGVVNVIAAMKGSARSIT
jgi:hypothetical protein